LRRAFVSNPCSGLALVKEILSLEGLRNKHI
jgi:hypothetical protein